TAGGAHLLKDIWPGSHGSDIADLTRLPDGRVLFTAQDPEHGYELWVTDGTADGTALLYDINDGDGSLRPGNFAGLADGRVVFVASNTAAGSELWVTDGTRDGTQLMMDLVPGPEGTSFWGSISPLADGRFIFGAAPAEGSSGITGSTLYVSDGTSAGTTALSHLSGELLQIADGRVFFDGGDHFKVTDGTPEGTHSIEGVAAGLRATIRNPIGDGAILISVVADGAQPWGDLGKDAISYYVTDGTDAHLLLKADYNGKGSWARDIGNGKTVLNVYVDGVERLIVTDGTEAGTKTLLSGREANQVSSFASLGDGRALLVEGYSQNERSLKLFDGERMTELASGNDLPASASVSGVVQLSDGSFLFNAAPSYAPQVWRTDLTPGGTHIVPEMAGVNLGARFLELGTTSEVPGPQLPPDPPIEPPTTDDTEPPSGPSEPHHEWSPVNALFDTTFYLAHNPDVATAGGDPLQHFMRFGAAEGRDPNSHFDVSFYLNQNPDVLAAGVNALEHYMSSGWKEGREASIAFDGDAYLVANADVAKAGINPLLHYLHHGEAEGRDAFQATPHATGPQDPLVDATFYYATYQDVAKEGVDATQHFMASGWKEGRDANAFFDTDWYLATYQDVASAGINPLEHYLQFGTAEGRDPSSSFDGDAYLARHSDVAQAEVNPLVHYVQHGQFEGRDIFVN
ncbi:hypothetical protein CR165_23575, partial [Pseudoroseomonas aestuarii]